MKDGERLVWAAAFAHSLAGIDYNNEDAALERMGKASTHAYAAVLALRKLGEASTRFPAGDAPGWAMLRDMAGLTH